MDASADPIGLLLDQHEQLEDLFAQHQEALVERRWDEAARALEEYSEHLKCHIELEERHLLPQCAHLQTLRWSGDVYRAEHRRIELLLHKAAGRLAQARRGGITSRALIALLDHEGTLKHLIEHHHEREEKGLFRELRSELSVEARASFVRDVIGCELH